ncbi:MAG: diguanylate cyclase/phosphodiesterase (GGDEF & EAL domains) with PAS/PAC sensor(s) [uncultured Acetobacteraceae bacterium]|uniref:histidine kinase n=1 Tax=uncultured Acetobacteraceae bacterium TaxID=169975 RepID=A0A6J4HRA0_9PROT|nr:MAG: diguanylate cyclase/phosphodiesterase (GGDEF & EAL domains) with PAS/PAC sensor(s) [uncultured Acetobacteraceae bacterium]
MAVTDIQVGSSDAARIAALDDLAILDTEPEVGFDDIVLLASEMCGTPVALVSLVAENRQWFKARVGFPACETPLSQSVCSLALRQGGTFTIPDLALDERTKGSPLVARDPFIRFYAGAPLRTREGVPIGMLCVIDTEPRPAGLSEVQTRGLEALARQVEAQLELRRLLAERAGAAAERLAMEAARKRHQELLSLELGHRLKNILALVHSIAERTLRGAEVPAEARSALLDRIRALGKAQDILLAGSAEAASMSALVRDATGPHDRGGDGARFRVSGPEIAVGAKAALMLALALHELSTNAAKYGALSSPGGTVDIGWSIAAGGGEPVVELVWRESGGPAVAPPRHEGFGTRLIGRALAETVRGTAALEYPPGGAVCRIEAPLSGFSNAGA